MKKALIILVSIIGLVIIANAQDVILKKDASEIKAKVLEITEQQVKYKDFDFQDGPTRNISIYDVFMITYENGKKEVFNKSAETTSPNDRKQNSEVKEENEQKKQIESAQESHKRDFVLSKKAEIIVDCFAAYDCAIANKKLVEKFIELGFCCIHTANFKNNTTASITIAIRNFGGGLRFDINDRRQGDIVVFSKMYSKAHSFKGILKKFINDIEHFIDK